MAESVYKVIELIGTSKESWEKAAAAAVSRAGKSLRDLRVAEVVKLDLQLDAKGEVEAYRAKLNVSFKFEGYKLMQCVGWAKRACAVPTISSNRKMVGTRSLSSGARSRDPVALPTLQIFGFAHSAGSALT